MSTKVLTRIASADPVLSPFVSPLPAFVATALAEIPHMNEADLKKILACVDEVLEVYRKNDGRLTALEVSVKSMLAVVRSQVGDQLSRKTAMAGAGE